MLPNAHFLRRAVLVLRATGIGVFVLAVLGLGAETELSMPYNARVFINPVTNRYVSPPCLSLSQEQEQQIATKSRETTSYRDSMRVFVAVSGLYPAVYQEMVEQKFHADPSCSAADGFSMKDRSMTGLVLQRVGLLKPLPRRWSKDGSWNW